MHPVNQGNPQRPPALLDEEDDLDPAALEEEQRFVHELAARQQVQMLAYIQECTEIISRWRPDRRYSNFLTQLSILANGALHPMAGNEAFNVFLQEMRDAVADIFQQDPFNLNQFNFLVGLLAAIATSPGIHRPADEQGAVETLLDAIHALQGAINALPME